MWALCHEGRLNKEILEKANSGLKLILALLFLNSNGSERNQLDNVYKNLIYFVLNNKVENLGNFNLIFERREDKNLAKHLENFIYRFDPFK